MSRRQRGLQKQFKVFCEGDTEYNYFEYIRKYKHISLAIKPINMGGGGYSNYLEQLEKDANSNCLAKFIVIDGDRAISTINEDRCLLRLIEFCKIQNESQRIPHILIINMPDFEYVACLHLHEYKNQDCKQFITQRLGYKSLEDFKADENVFEVLTAKKAGNLGQLKMRLANSNAMISNRFSVKQAKYEISVEMKYSMDNMGKKGSNFQDFYKVLEKFDLHIE